MHKCPNCCPGERETLEQLALPRQNHYEFLDGMHIEIIWKDPIPKEDVLNICKIAPKNAHWMFEFNLRDKEFTYNTKVDGFNPIPYTVSLFFDIISGVWNVGVRCDWVEYAKNEHG